MISIDTKKKEILGNHKNVGKEWTPKGKPREVKVHDFIDKKLGKAIPYGVYDIGQNKGFVSVGWPLPKLEYISPISSAPRLV